MQKKSVLIIAEKKNYELYHSLPVLAKSIDVNSLKYSVKSIPRSDKFDVLLLDCGFDSSGGLRLLRKIKSFCPEIPIIFLTDISSENIATEAFRIGAREYYKKPVNIFELKDTIGRLLKIMSSSKERRTPLVKKQGAIVKPLRIVTTDIPTNLLRPIGYIEEHLSNPEGICLEKLAKEACLSKYHFCRIFKRTIKISPMRFVEFMRVQRAKELLARNDVRISAVAYYVGVNDFSNFTRMFKKHTGITPSIYKSALNSSSVR